MMYPFLPLWMYHILLSIYRRFRLIGDGLDSLLKLCRIYLLQTEFEGRTVSYGPSFFLLDLWPKREARGPWIEGEKRGSVTYNTDWENEVSKIFIISLVCVWRAQERFLFTRNGFKFLKHLESKTSQFEIAFKSLAREGFKFVLAMKVKNSWR